jgi:hypothetical protein
MRKEWREFLNGLDATQEFLHADELEERYGVAGLSLPAIFRREDRDIEVLVGADSINACSYMPLINALPDARCVRLDSSLSRPS